MIKTNARWSTLFFATAAGLTLLWGCRFAPGKPFTYKGTIDTEFDISSGENFQVGAYYFGEPFELLPGTIGAKFSTRVSQAQVGLLPRSLQMNLVWLDPTLTTIHQTYSLSAPLKMSPHGGNYEVSYKFNTTTFSGFNLGLHDYLRMDIQPNNGTLTTGLRLNMAYTYRPTM